MKKFPIIRMFAQFDPHFGPLEADNCLNNENYLVYTIRICLKRTLVMFFLIYIKFAEFMWRKCPNSVQNIPQAYENKWQFSENF